MTLLCLLLGACDALRSEPLVVVDWSPRAGFLADPTGTAVFVLFSAPVDKTRAELAFSLTSANAQVPGRVSWASDERLEFRPWHPFEAETDFTLKVGTQAEDLRGNSLARDFTVDFNTRTVTGRPRLVSFSPADASRVPGRYPDVVIAFDQAMDTASVMARLAISPSYKGRLSWDNALATFTFSAVEALEWQTEYTVTVPAETRSAGGRELGAAATWRFTPGEDTVRPTVVRCENGSGGLALSPDDPGDASMLVNPGWEKDYAVRLVFSEPMERASAEGALSITPEASWVSSWDDASTELTLTFREHLAHNTTYALRINEAAKDLFGNTVVRPITWRFRVDGPRSTPPRLDSLRLLVVSYPSPTGRIQQIFDRSAASPYVYAIPFFYRQADASTDTTPKDVSLEFVFSVSDGATIDRMSFAESVTVLPSGNSLTFTPEGISINHSGTTCTVSLTAKLADSLYSGSVRISVYKGLLDDYGNTMGADWVFDVLDLD